jgi:hypothetical protein
VSSQLDQWESRVPEKSMTKLRSKLASTSLASSLQSAVAYDALIR